ncbi:unnamed protein product [Closterium sp. NIES-54]
MVTTTTLGGQRVSICMCTRTGRHLATFTRRPGSSPVAAPRSCRLLSHQTLLWHHRLGHPYLPRLRGMHSRLLVSGLPRSLPPLPPLLALPCLPCIEGRQRAAPHSSSFPPTSAPLQTHHMDVWGPARVSGQDRERYFMLVVDNYTRYTTVFPFRSKGEVPDVLIPWIRAVRLQLRERILQSFTLPASPQQDGVAERRIGFVMKVARTSMIHAAAPHFLGPFVVRYAAHQLNLWPRVSLPETLPTLRWMGKVGDVSVFRVQGSRAFVRNTSADKLSSHAIPCGPAPSGVSQVDPLAMAEPVNVTVDLGVARGAVSGGGEPGTAEPGGAERASAEPGGAEPEGAEPGGAEAEGVESGGAEPEGAEPGGAKPEGAEPGGAKSKGAESGGAEPRGTASAGGPSGTRVGGAGATSPGSARVTAGAGGTGARGAGAGGAVAGDPGAGGPVPGGTRAGGAGATSPGGAGVTAGAGGPGGTGAGDPGAGGTGAGGAGARGAGAGGTGVVDPGPGGARAGDSVARGTGAGGAGSGGAGARDPVVGDAGAGGAGAGGAGAEGTGAVDPGAGGAGAGDPGDGGAGAGGAGAGSVDARGTVQRRPFFVPPPPSSLPPPDSVLRQPDSPPPAPSPYTEQTDSLTERREPESRPASPVRDVRTGPRVPRACPPPIPDTHIMALRPSSVPLRVPLPSPLASSLADGPDPESDLVRAANPTVPCLLATVVIDPSFDLVAESEPDCSPSVGGDCALGTDVLEDRQEDFECLVAALLDLVAMLLAPEGNPDTPDIPTPCSYAEAITSQYSSQWQTAMDAEMASLKSTSTYVDAVPPSGANIVDGMWIFRVKRPSGSLLVFKTRYVARGFNQRQGVDFFQNFSPTPKMTTLRVLLHVAAQHDYELHSLDFSTAFLQGSLHEEIWLRHPPGFTGSFPAGTQTTIAALGFAPSTADPSLFLRTDTSLPLLYILVYVDDLVFATADTVALSLVKSELQKKHTCTDLGELPNYLGLQITRDRARRTITPTKSHMVHQVLQRFGFWYSSPQSTPLPTGHSLSAPPSDESVEPSGPYPELVGCLIQSSTACCLSVVTLDPATKGASTFDAASAGTKRVLHAAPCSPPFAPAGKFSQEKKQVPHAALSRSSPPSPSSPSSPFSSSSPSLHSPSQTSSIVSLIPFPVKAQLHTSPLPMCDLMTPQLTNHPLFPLPVSQRHRHPSPPLQGPFSTVPLPPPSSPEALLSPRRDPCYFLKCRPRAVANCCSKEAGGSLWLYTPAEPPAAHGRHAGALSQQPPPLLQQQQCSFGSSQGDVFTVLQPADVSIAPGKGTVNCAALAHLQTAGSSFREASSRFPATTSGSSAAITSSFQEISKPPSASLAFLSPIDSSPSLALFLPLSPPPQPPSSAAPPAHSPAPPPRSLTGSASSGATE